MTAPPILPTSSAFHALLLLSDSALPLGSFAFSNGLESFLTHRNIKPSSTAKAQFAAFTSFVRLSLLTLSSTALPYVLAAHRDPAALPDLDNDFDASTPCTVARRASVAQGRALLGVWERSFRGAFEGAGEERVKERGQDGIDSHSGVDEDDNAAKPEAVEAIHALKEFQALLAGSAGAGLPAELMPNAHLAPLWGVVTRALGLSLSEAIYLFLFSHARTVISAGVRASVLGPYQAQGVLAGKDLQEWIRVIMKEMWDTQVQDAGQAVPVMDLWVGRHEKLYSRIFNS